MIEFLLWKSCVAGDYSDAKIVGESIGMTTLSSSAFESVLEQMVQPNKNGSITLTFSKLKF